MAIALLGVDEQPLPVERHDLDLERLRPRRHRPALARCGRAAGTGRAGACSIQVTAPRQMMISSGAAQITSSSWVEWSPVGIVGDLAAARGSARRTPPSAPCTGMMISSISPVAIDQSRAAGWRCRRTGDSTTMLQPASSEQRAATVSSSTLGAWSDPARCSRLSARPIRTAILPLATRVRGYKREQGCRAPTQLGRRHSQVWSYGRRARMTLRSADRHALERDARRSHDASARRDRDRRHHRADVASSSTSSSTPSPRCWCFRAHVPRSSSR